MNHGSYVHFRTGTIVIVLETITQDGGGSITYASDAAGYGGFLNFTIEHHPEYGQSLIIKTMNADPARQGLGALLVWHAANTAIFRACPHMVALGVYGDAQPFYAKVGFLPSVKQTTAIAEEIAKGGVSRAGQEALFSAILIWGGKTDSILDKSYDIVKNTWIRSYAAAV